MPGPCDPNRLGLLLGDRVGDDFRQELEAHLPACAACRARLEQLTGGPGWQAEVRHYLAELPDELSTSEGSCTPAAAEDDLAFLQPAETPGVLGRLGPYEVHEVLGRGGWGVVLKAFDPVLHRPVAVKVLAAKYAANGTARKRFAREAQAAAAISHDHVVPVHAVDPDATPPYLVMAFIPGQSLQQRIDRSGPLALKEILRIGMQTAQGLAAAHAQGLVHRDIKPANIMLENGVERVRITDFGLARAVDDASVTQGQTVTGTPQYMAPEQARGENVDQRADLFALGSTLYATCTGRPPFRGEGSLAVLRQVCDAEPPPIRTLNPDVPAWLEGIVRKLHAKDPAQRFASAAVVAELLERCLAHVQQPGQHRLPAVAAELGRQVQGPRPARRRYGLAGVALAAVLAIAAPFVLSRPAPEDPLVPAPRAGDDPARISPVPAGAGVPAVLRLPPAADWPGEGAGLEPALERTRQQVEELRQELHGSTELGPDPVSAGIQDIRRRLEKLQR